MAGLGPFLTIPREVRTAVKFLQRLPVYPTLEQAYSWEITLIEMR